MINRLNGQTTRKNSSLRSWFKVILVSVLLLSVSSTCLLSRYSPIFSEENLEKRSFILSITSTFENENPNGKTWNLSEEERTISLFMNNTWQTVYLLNSSHPIGKIQKDNDGNPTASLILPASKISAGENLTYHIVYKIILKPRLLPSISENQSGRLDDIDEELKKQYCRANGPWQVELDELQTLAFKIAGNETNVLSLLKKFILWIKRNIKYKTYDLPRYPIETVIAKAGDCDDQANLLIVFCRIIGIPAYLQAGCIYLPQQNSERTYWDGHWILKLTRIGWHGWAVVYIPPWGWLPVDLTYAPGILSDPINAIRRAAIIITPTFQYVNITETDYIVSSQKYREFLVSNGFKIYEHDAMFEEEKHRETENLRLPLLHIFVSLSISPNLTERLFIREDSIRRVLTGKLGECL